MNWTVQVGGVNSSSTATVVTLALSNGSYSYELRAQNLEVATPNHGMFNVTGASLVIPIAFTPGVYAVTFTESGLPADLLSYVGTNWNVKLTMGSWAELLYSQGMSTISFAVGNGTYAYASTYLEGFGADSGRGPTGNVTITGAGVEIGVHMSVFMVTFFESGLPWATYWNLTVLGIDTVNMSGGDGPVSAALPNGTYSYAAYAEGCYHFLPYSASFVVNGANSSLNLTGGRAHACSLVTFTESNVPPSSGFEVQLGRDYNLTELANSSIVTFWEPNGTYQYNAHEFFTDVPPLLTGTVVVSGPNITIQLNFPPPSGPAHYSLVFAESGLPDGTTWEVEANGSASTSAFSTNSFREPNGTYAYIVGSLSGYSASPPSGSATVNGGATSVSVTFTSTHAPGRYTVNFTESGLPSASLWGIALNGSTKNSTAPTISFSETNGSYGFNVGCGSGYGASPSAGYANVSGTNLNQSVVCKNETGLTPVGLVPVTFRASGLSSGDSWSVTLTAGSDGLVIELVAALTRSASEPSSIFFEVAPGMYSYSASAVGFQAASGSVDTTHVAPAPVSVEFVASPHTSGDPSPTLALAGPVVAVGIGLVVIGALGLGLTVWRYRARERQRGQILVEEIGHADWARDSNGDAVIRWNR